MLNFAERTGCGAVIMVWSFLKISDKYLSNISNYFAIVKVYITQYPLWDLFLESHGWSSLITMRLKVVQVFYSTTMMILALSHASAYLLVPRYAFRLDASYHVQYCYKWQSTIQQFLRLFEYVFVVKYTKWRHNTFNWLHFDFKSHIWKTSKVNAVSQ